jgi:ubiquinone/menaquinone biosynthesis C-methylase UbiE
MWIMSNTKDWYQDSYESSGLSAQRLYPNEELLRFMGRNYFSIPASKRKKIKVLEIGSGSCSNLWMISREGFDSYGIDLSSRAIELGQKMLDHWGAKKAELQVASMTNIPYKNEYFDVVIDVFSSYCLDEADYAICLSEVQRVLKKNGRFFSYTPGKKSDAFLNHYPAKLLDKSTLSGIYRNNSPFKENHYPFRFIHPEEQLKAFELAGFNVEYLETVQRSYFGQKEIFEHIVVEGIKE